MFQGLVVACARQPGWLRHDPAVLLTPRVLSADSLIYLTVVRETVRPAGFPEINSMLVYHLRHVEVEIVRKLPALESVSGFERKCFAADQPTMSGPP